MRLIIAVIFFLLSFCEAFSQRALKVTYENGSPVPFAILKFPDGIHFTNQHGEYILEDEQVDVPFVISYPGFRNKSITITPYDLFVQVRLSSVKPAQKISTKKNTARSLISAAIKNLPETDPQRKLLSYQYKTYNKLFIDKEPSNPGIISFEPAQQDTLGRRFLSEYLAVESFNGIQGSKRVVEAISTAGLDSPAYHILGMNLDPPSIYKKEYPLYYTRYAGPLHKNAFKNYSFQILDTVSKFHRPVYVVHFQPKRPRSVPGLEGILLLDTLTLAVQYAKLGTSGEIRVEAEHHFKYFEKEDVWFPVQQELVIKPGTGGTDISLFGGSINLGTVQKKFSLLDILLVPGKTEEDLFLKSTSINYDFRLNEPVKISRYSAMVKVNDDAGNRTSDFWKENRQLPVKFLDSIAPLQLEKKIAEEQIEKKIQIAHGLSNGYYPLGIWNFDLSRFLGYNKYEGIKLGLGGETNSNFSEFFRINGYTRYGFKDRSFKYGVGAGIFLNRGTGSWFNINYRNDIREIASHNYLKGEKEFAILEPRLVNISYYYAHEDLEASLEHRITPRLETQFLINRSDVSQLTNYAFINNGKVYRNYTISEAKMAFLWRPYSRFISTPKSFNIYSRAYPVITGQISRSISGMFGGDFDFTKIGLKAEYKSANLDRSSTHLILEGNIAYGELPLTHAFHAFPNNANKPGLRQRFAVAGKLSFETMYFNEFFSDRQAAFHIRYQLRPLNIAKGFQPHLVLISRHVIGNFEKPAVHQNINFKTLEHVFSEAGLEINQIFLGFGLSGAYRYGAYHLPGFKENLSLKFTFTLQI